MLHVHCGDSSADSLRRSGVPGTVMVWTELLFDGPMPAGVCGEGWLEIRARFLSDHTGGALAVERVKARLERQDQELCQFMEHDEVVLWFDACLFDQAILVRHLDWFSACPLGGATLSLICVGEFPGFPNFRGLGELMPQQLASLLEKRHRVTPAELSLGRLAWAAFRSPAPTSIESLLAQDTTALPYLADALRRDLEEFPSVRNGLSRLEHEALDVVSEGANRLGPIFVAVSDREERPFFGDTYLWACLDRLATGPDALLHIEGPGRIPLWEPTDIGRWRVDLTQTGREVLDGAEDWVALTGIDRWLGGVHLCGRESQWRWDEHNGRLVQSHARRGRT